MTAARALLVLGLTSCAIGGDERSGLEPPQPPPAGGADSLCSIGLDVVPASPVAGPDARVRVIAHLTMGPRAGSYRWRVVFAGTPVAYDVHEEGAEIEFATPTAGIYDVAVDVDGGNSACTTTALAINVAAPGARTQAFRLRVLPPPGAPAPPLDKVIQVKGGAPADLGTVALEGGMEPMIQVRLGGAGVPAYLRLSPASMPEAFVEAFADPAGNAVVRLLPQPHRVLVIPQGPEAGAAPPRVIADWSPVFNPPLVIDAGIAIGGTVRGPDSSLLAGAVVQLTVDGVPSTVATTDASGRFTVRAAATTGTITVEVTPQAATGLPRLSATSQSFQLGGANRLDVVYAANLARRDLAGVQVRRNGTPVAGARVTAVGTLAVGTVTAGASVNATGTVRIAARTDAAGALPAMLVPVAVLSAVIEVSPGDLAVTALDAATAVLDAPERRLVATAALGDDAGGAPAGLPGAVIDVVPIGALALAGAPSLRATAGESGAITALLASGGRYDLQLRDPVGRRAPLVVTDRDVTSVATSYRLPAALGLRGTVRFTNLTPIVGAAIQILCNACSGIERDTPLAEAISDQTGRFAIAVPDPGTL